MREYRYFPESGVTLALDTDGKRAHLTAIACSPEDTFNKRAGREIADLLFDADASTLKVLGLKRNIYSFPYSGTKIGEDIFSPLFADLKPALHERGVFRMLYTIFQNNIFTYVEAVSYGQLIGDKNFVEDYQDIVQQELTSSAMTKMQQLENEEDLYKEFFIWSGSVSYLQEIVRKFAAKKAKSAKTAPAPATP